MIKAHADWDGEFRTMAERLVMKLNQEPSSQDEGVVFLDGQPSTKKEMADHIRKRTTRGIGYVLEKMDEQTAERNFPLARVEPSMKEPGLRQQLWSFVRVVGFILLAAGVVWLWSRSGSSTGPFSTDSIIP